MTETLNTRHTQLKRITESLSILLICSQGSVYAFILIPVSDHFAVTAMSNKLPAAEDTTQSTLFTPNQVMEWSVLRIPSAAGWKPSW